MRLFTGISLDEGIVNNLEAVLTQLRPVAPLRWSPIGNLHITSKFIGEWPENRLPELTDALASIESPGKPDLTISRLGFFPNPHRPRFLFAGVHSGPELAALAQRMDEALEPLGCPGETHPYTPHVTLARFGKNDTAEGVRALRENIASMINFEYGSFVANNFHLFLSKPGRGGSVYAKLASFSL